MGPEPSRIWRPMFVVGGILYLGGSSQHPRGGMEQMLADPTWFPSHATVFVGLMVLTVGMALMRRQTPTATPMHRWLTYAVLATVLEAIEMGVHTMAYVDAAALVTGQSTPVLATHSWLATLIYPCFAIAMLGLIWVGQREHTLGSPWIGWLGVLGALTHGIVMVLVFILELAWATLLFPVAAITLSLWFILAGLWPVQPRVS